MWYNKDTKGKGKERKGKKMTVRELIERLNNIENQNMEIEIWDSEGYALTIENLKVIDEENEPTLIIEAL